MLVGTKGRRLKNRLGVGTPAQEEVRSGGSSGEIKAGGTRWVPETRVRKGRGRKTFTRSAGGGPAFTVEANSINVVIVTPE